MSVAARPVFAFDDSFVRELEGLYVRWQGVPVAEPRLLALNEELAAELGVDPASLRSDAGVDVLEQANVITWFLDPSIQFPNPTEATNLEPLLINTAGSWSDRPEAVTGIENLFLASDYVRTNTDLATMEGANEAARRAVNAILERSRSAAEPCALWKLREPPLFAPFRALDKVLFKLRRPARQRIRIRDGRIEAARPLAWAGQLAQRVSAGGR